MSPLSLYWVRSVKARSIAARAGTVLEPEELLEDIVAALAPKVLQGKRLLITAGPTFEPIDPVRGITNHSSGKMGFAIARAAAEAGADVTLVAGPVHLPTPRGVQRNDVQSAQQMHDAVLPQVPMFHANAWGAPYAAAMVGALSAGVPMDSRRWAQRQSRRRAKGAAVRGSRTTAERAEKSPAISA